MNRFLLLLSGEHPTLPYSEACAVLESEGVRFKFSVKHDQVLIVHAEQGLPDVIERRSALVMEGGRLILSSDASGGEIRRLCAEADWGFLEGRSFGVKVTRVKKYWKDLDTQQTQRSIGEAIIEATDSRVDLCNPDLWIRGVVTDAGFFLFEEEFQTDRHAFSSRKPRSRPYFHPGVLEAKIARAFVNLSRVKRGEVLADPFCGTGGFLIEAAFMGCRVCGMDLDMRMVLGAKRNLMHYGLSEDVDIVQGDATAMPLRGLGGIATDPPYGRGTSTMGGGVKKIISGFLEESHRVLEPGRFVCAAAPADLKPGEIAEAAGFKLREEHCMRVHKSLTRSIIVAERIE